MRTLLLRHFPELEPALQGVANPFAPWQRDGRRSAVTELAPGHPQPRPRQGRPRARLPRRRRRRAVARRHAVRDRRRLVLEAIRALGREPERPEADRDHARPPLASRRPRGAEARERRHRLRAPVGGGHRRRRPPRAAGQHPAAAVAASCMPFQLGLWLGRPKHVPCPVDELLDDGRRVRPVAGARTPPAIRRAPRVLLARAAASRSPATRSRPGRSSAPAGTRST